MEAIAAIVGLLMPTVSSEVAKTAQAFHRAVGMLIKARRRWGKKAHPAVESAAREERIAWDAFRRACQDAGQEEYLSIVSGKDGGQAAFAGCGAGSLREV